jgi:hypothetical protein
VAADVSEIANVGLKLIPVALIGKTNNGIEPSWRMRSRTRRQRRSRATKLNLAKPKPLSPLLIIPLALAFLWSFITLYGDAGAGSS